MTESNGVKVRESDEAARRLGRLFQEIAGYVAGDEIDRSKDRFIRGLTV